MGMDGPRTIDVGTPPDRFARGWYCLGLANRFRDGDPPVPHEVQAFGTKLVVFADSTGQLHVLDAYCRHMGGDLTMGTVKGDQVACPFHDWRWGGDGRCAQIPYGRRVPPAARTRSWLTLERNGQLFVWLDPEGNPPPDDVTIPRIEGSYTAEWTDWTWDSILVEGANCREVIDNVVDMAHFFYIHFAFPTYFKNVFEGTVATQYLRTRSRPDVGALSNYSDGGETTLRSEASYFGPSYMIDNLWQDYHGMAVESVLINCHYPVTPTSFMLQWGVIVKRPPGLSDGQAARFGTTFAKFVGLGFEQDVQIWMHKSRVDNPLLCAEDGPVYQLRRWYEQFYRDVADIEPDMVARYEFELDTTRPVAGWEAEVAENLAARRAAAEAVTEDQAEDQAEDAAEAGLDGRPQPFLGPRRRAPRPPAAGRVRSVRRDRAGGEVQPAAHVGPVDRRRGGVLRGVPCGISCAGRRRQPRRADRRLRHPARQH
jgi:3-ketosteroid 9alpha-monooxygenase subunit A